MSRHHPALLFALIVALSNVTMAEGRPPAAEAPLNASTDGRSLTALNSSPIQDNSFLVEDSYNQEDGVVQHISLLQHLSTGDWAFTLPVSTGGKRRHASRDRATNLTAASHRQRGARSRDGRRRHPVEPA